MRFSPLNSITEGRFRWLIKVASEAVGTGTTFVLINHDATTLVTDSGVDRAISVVVKPLPFFPAQAKNDRCMRSTGVESYQPLALAGSSIRFRRLSGLMSAQISLM
jgi:hypothetical protein